MLTESRTLIIAKAIAASDARLRPPRQVDWDRITPGARSQYLRNAAAVESALNLPIGYPVPPVEHIGDEADDEELADVFAEAVNKYNSATTTNGALVAGIRAVRERLAVTEVTDAMVGAAMAAWRANGGLLYLGDPWPIRAALAAALAEAGKDGQDG